MDAVVGMIYPLIRTGDDSDKALAKSKLDENIMAAVFTGTGLQASFHCICLLLLPVHHYDCTKRYVHDC